MQLFAFFGEAKNPFPLEKKKLDHYFKREQSELTKLYETGTFQGSGKTL